jgi:hypothetical protein
MIILPYLHRYSRRPRTTTTSLNTFPFPPPPQLLASLESHLCPTITSTHYRHRGLISRSFACQIGTTSSTYCQPQRSKDPFQAPYWPLVLQSDWRHFHLPGLTGRSALANRTYRLPICRRQNIPRPLFLLVPPRAQFVAFALSQSIYVGPTTVICIALHSCSV